MQGHPPYIRVALENSGHQGSRGFAEQSKKGGLFRRGTTRRKAGSDGEKGGASIWHQYPDCLQEENQYHRRNNSQEY